ncbi:MAG: tetratricopeptide repeat protein [Caldilineaceae bacterium]|nr:tetratricopeptide repeat protein [Caldilineaceae bacterium]
MSHLSLRVLGPPHITLDGQSITTLAYDKVWALLVYLALAADRAHRRTTLAGLLWPDQPEPVARTNLRQALARLRQAIGDDQATPPFLLVDRENVQFNAASDHDCDVAEFSALLAACATHTHRQDATCAVCAEWRSAAVAHYRGPLLERFSISDSDLFEEWATVARERLHQQALDALDALAIYHERRGDYGEALRFNLHQLELDPWREEAHRQAMRVLALNGQRSAALAQYERCRETLAAELGVEPSPETTSLYERIRANRLADGHGSDDPLALPTTRSHNLPVQPTPFLGRQPELAALAAYLANPQCRLITLLGPGGIGKTRLALQAAAEHVDAFAHGVTFVELAPLASAELIAPTLAAALGMTLSGPAMPQSQVLTYLRQKDVLLVLDNFEHLLTPTTSPQPGQGNNPGLALLAELLRQAPGVTLLVTTRERLNLHGEWLFAVGALETPPTAASQPGDGEEAPLETYSAPALFLQTARRVQKDFNPTTADKAAIVQICHLVEGMPLALELAAAWVRVLSCKEIAQGIEQGLALLTTTLRDLPARHRSLQAVFDHSWKLLGAEEQRVFAACAVFRGGFTREAAAEVAGASLSLLAALVDKSLLRRQLNGRYEVHELARQYAAARLAEADQEVQTRHRHLDFFMRFAEAAEPQIRAGEQIVQWHRWVESEHDNLRAALDWSLSSGELEPGLRMVAALWEFWMNRGYAPEGQSQAERFLAHPETAAYPVLRGKALHTAGVCAFYQGRYRVALAWLVEAAAIGRALGASGKYVLAMTLIAQGFTRSSLQEFDAVPPLSQEALLLGEELQVAWVKGNALYQLAGLAWRRGDYASARQYFLESLACVQTHVMRGYILQGLGTMHGEQGDYQAAREYIRQTLPIYEEMGDRVRSSNSYTRLARLAMAQGNDGEAEELLAKALILIRKTGHLRHQVETLDAMGRLAQRQGDDGRARTLHEESLALCMEMEDPVWLAHTLEAFACLAARQGQAEAAVRLFGATAAYATPPEATFDPVWRREHDHWVATARAHLGDAAFDAAWVTGQAMSLEQSVAYTVTSP